MLGAAQQVCFFSLYDLPCARLPASVLYLPIIGTRVGDAMGAEKAREFLGHEFGSRTFETSYNQGLVAFDAVAIALGRTRQSNDELLEGLLQTDSQGCNIAQADCVYRFWCCRQPHRSGH